MRAPSPSLRRSALVASVIAAPFLLAATLSSTGCGPDKPTAKPPPKGSGSSSIDAGVSSTDAAPPSSDAPSANDAWSSDAIPGDALTLVTDAGGDGGAAPCWKGFATTGNAVPDLNALAARCAAGMTPLVGPVKQAFKQGESKIVPVVFVPACYRIIAVGGTGLKDVDLILRDNTGKVVAADETPNDMFPMIHPNKEFCVDALQILNLAIVVKKGAGEVAGGVYKK